MPAAFDRQQLLAAFDEIAHAAINANTRLEIAVFGGSALILAGNFRFATEDVDIAEIGRPWPDWLSQTVERIAARNGWTEHWFNDAITLHLSQHADAARDLVEFGSFPRGLDPVGLTVFVPTARYMLALKLKALRLADPGKGPLDIAGVMKLLKILDINDVEQAIAILAEYFPKTAADADKQRFVLRRILSGEGPTHAPSYPRRQC
jgi:hypothetical protein